TRRARRIQCGGIEFQPAAFRDAARATVEEESGLEVLLHDRDAILDVSEGLSVATGKRRSIDERWNRERTRASRDRHRSSGRDKRHGRNGTDVVAADVVFATHVETAVGRDFLAAETGGVGDAGAIAENISVFVDRTELFELG